MRYKAFDI